MYMTSFKYALHVGALGDLDSTRQAVWRYVMFVFLFGFFCVFCSCQLKTSDEVMMRCCAFFFICLLGCFFPFVVVFSAIFMVLFVVFVFSKKQKVTVFPQNCTIDSATD